MDTKMIEKWGELSSMKKAIQEGTKGSVSNFTDPFTHKYHIEQDKVSVCSFDGCQHHHYSTLEAIEKLSGNDNAVRQLAQLKSLACREIDRVTNELAIQVYQYVEGLDPEPELRLKGFNRLKFAGDYEDGTVEWHRFRHSGIGGSDAVKLTYARSAQFLLAEKASPFTAVEDEKKVESFNVDDMGATHRGTAMEPFIRRLFADKHPDLTVVAAPGSWCREDKPYIHANFDGMIVKNGSPVGIVEIKTGTTGGKTVWGDPCDGLQGLPKKYKYQVLWYCLASGLRSGVLVALLDGNDYREYHFNIDDDQELIDLEAKADDFWAKVPSGLAFSNPKKSSLGGMSLESYASFLTSLGVTSPVDTTVKNKKIKETVRVEQIRNGLRSIIEGETASPTFYGLDLETNAFDPNAGSILQLSVVKYKIGETPELIYNSFYGLDDFSLHTMGLGATDVHRITDASAPTWDDKADELQELLQTMSGGVLVAHNTRFEMSWLSAHLPGFSQAVTNGDLLVLDTMKVCQYLMSDMENNTLESFVTYQGIPYEGAHRSDADTLMMMRAFDKWVHIFVSEE